MAIAATEQLLEWTVAAIADGLQAVTGDIARRADELGFDVPAADQSAPHMLGIELPPDLASGLGQSLCEHAVVASVRGRSLRIAPHLHTTPSDVDRLIDALAAST
jgi:selenocysteine lyase/cysteine desulfurase